MHALVSLFCIPVSSFCCFFLGSARVVDWCPVLDLGRRLERTAVSDAFFEDPGSLKKVLIVRAYYLGLDMVCALGVCSFACVTCGRFRARRFLTLLTSTFR
jgi:hypothetical protein